MRGLLFSVLLAGFVILLAPVHTTAQWQIWKVDSMGVVGLGTSIDADRNNYPHISYYDETNGDLRYAYWNGSGWVIDTVDMGGDVGKYTSLELDSLDYPNIAYYDATNEDLKYAYWDGANWVIQVIDTRNVGDTYVSLDLDPVNGYRHISYQRDNRLTHAWWDGASWLTEVVDPNPWTGYNCSIDLDPNNNHPCISYVDALSDWLTYAYWDGLTWNFETVDNTAMYTSLATHSDGVAHIAYDRVTSPFTMELKHAWKPTPIWQTETVLDYGCLFPSIAVDAAGNPHISFCDGQSADLRYASKNGVWSVDIVDGNIGVGLYNSLVLRNGVDPCISYYDEPNGDLKCACSLVLDVGVDSILAPPDTVPPGTHAVAALFKNYGTSASDSCPAYCTITPLYSDTITVPALASGQDTNLPFQNWTENIPGTYTMRVVTNLIGDSVVGNDTLSKRIAVWQAIHDCGVDTILSPPDTVFPGMDYPVEVQVQNFGNVLELCDVQAWDIHMGGVYNQVVTCSLNVGEQKVVRLSVDWTGPPFGTPWQIRARTICAGDTNTANDSTCKDIVVLSRHDVGVDTILSPPDTVDPFVGPYPIEFVVHNYGSWTEDTVQVGCRINPDGYVASGVLISLAPGAEDTVDLTPGWTPSTPGPWTICAWASVVGDSNPANDTLCKTVYPYLHDGGVEAILSPPSLVSVGDTYPVEALVRNYGTIIEDSVELICAIDGYVDTTWVLNLAPDARDTAAFRDWTVPHGGIFTMCCTTRVVGDLDPTNDRECKTIETFLGVEELEAEGLIPGWFALSQSSPNPFTHATVISYAMPGARHTTLSVYDLTGSLVRTLVDKAQKPGYYWVVWDGRDQSGADAPSGVYFYRLTSGQFTATRKMVLLR